MKNRQIIEMMRDIDPKYQQKAKQRAAEVCVGSRRSNLPSILTGAAAVGCLAFAAAIILPNLPKNDLVQNEPVQQELQEMTESTELAEAAVCSAPFGDLSDAIVRFISPAYAPYALEITADAQRELAGVLAQANWQETGTQAVGEMGMPDGEYISMLVYDPVNPLVMTFSLADNQVRVMRCGVDSEWHLYDIQTAVEAVRAAAESCGEGAEKRLTWVDQDTIGTENFWKNFSIAPKVCDMNNKEDVFYKMSNSADYFNCASGIVKTGYKCDDGFHADFIMMQNTFQVNINMGMNYGLEEYYSGPDAETLMNGGEGISLDEGASESYTDSDSSYYIYRAGGEYSRFEGGAMHRIDSEPIENDQHRSDREDDMWYPWQERTLLCNCAGRFCLENYTQILGYLYDFNAWDIVGREVIDGRECVHIQGDLSGRTEDSPQVKDGTAIVKNFDIYADVETGATIKLLGYDENGVLVRFIVTENLAFEDAAEPVQMPDLSGLTEYCINDIEPIPREDLPAQDDPESVVPVEGDV